MSESDSPRPVAWMAYATDGSEAATTCLNREVTEVIAEFHGWQVVPLYLSPNCPYVTGTVTRYCTLTPVTLTEAEREAVEYAAVTGRVASDMDREVLRGLLERTSGRT